MTYMRRVSGDPSKPRSWSKYASDSSSKKNDEITNVKSTEGSIKSVEKDNAEKTESKKRSKTKNKPEEENAEVRKALEKVL